MNRGMAWYYSGIDGRQTDFPLARVRDWGEGTGPVCRCGSRNTARIGESALTRQCQACGQTYAYRLKDGLLIPYALETALAMDGK